MLFLGEKDFKKFIFKTAEADLKKYLTLESLVLFAGSLLSLAEQHDSEYRLLEMIEELHELLSGLDIDKEHLPVLKGLIDEIQGAELEEEDEKVN